MTIEVRLTQNQEELEDIYKLRYKIYIEEMHRKQTYADHLNKTIIEPLDETGKIIGAYDDGVLIGTVRVNFAKDSHLGYYLQLYDMERFGRFHPKYTSITTKLMTESKYRGAAVATMLAEAAYELATQNEILFNFIDCNKHLVKFFLFLGYRFYKEEIQHYEYGEVTPLVLTNADLEYFRKINSPFARLIEPTYLGQESLDFFYSQILQQEPLECVTA